MKKFLLSVATALSCMALQAQEATYNVSLTVPFGDEVFMGAKTKHFVPFTEHAPVEVENNEAEGKSVTVTTFQMEAVTVSKCLLLPKLYRHTKTMCHTLKNLQ